MSATVDTVLTPATVTAEEVDVEFVLSVDEWGLWGYREYQFGHLPGYNTFDPEREVAGREAWEVYSALSQRVDAYLGERLVEAVKAWDAGRRYGQVRAEARSRGWLSQYDKPVAKGDRWGAINERYAGGGTGLRFVGCEGHGGYLVSVAREMGIPQVFRQGRVYEEDCGWAVVGLFYPEAVARCKAIAYGSVDKVLAESVESVVRWNKGAVLEFLGVSAADVAVALA